MILQLCSYWCSVGGGSASTSTELTSPSPISSKSERIDLTSGTNIDLDFCIIIMQSIERAGGREREETH